MSSWSGADGGTVAKRIERVLATIPSVHNSLVVERYLKERRVNGVKPSTLATDVNALRGFCQHLGKKQVEKFTRDDFVAYLNDATRVRIWRNGDKDGRETITKRRVALGDSTLSQRKIVIRAFLRWLRGTDEYPPEVRGLKGRPINHDTIPTDALLSGEDLRALIQAHTDPRDKALISVLHDSGLRAAELCSLNIGSVEFDQYGAVLTLPKKAPGLKTGARRVRLHESVPYLHAWYETHPRKDDQRSALFYSMSRRAPMRRMTPNALWQFCRRAAKKADLGKDVHPHLFRHSAATERARLGWTEAMMRAFFGWARSSDMPSRYVHLAGQDYERMDLERRGLLKDGDHARPALAPLRCKVCKAENLPTATFCQLCRNPVSPAAEAELQRRREEEVSEAASKIALVRMRELVSEEVARIVGEKKLA